jgi:hypothetical protein
MSYHFVKFQNTWYLKPESVQDIIDHFKKICGREFKDGFEDFVDNTVIAKDRNGKPYRRSMNHSSSIWRIAVEYGMDLKGISWLESANTLEQRTFEDRIKLFNDGRALYLRDGMPYYCANEHPEYDEEVWSEELVYPYEYNYDDVRFMQWPGGYHWYAKIGSMDIVDKYGNQKWSDKSYAIEIAKRFCACGGDWSKDKEKY